MKCEIIRDLLPSYVDGLTSRESNEAIEEHMADCGECAEILCQMKKEVEAVKEEDIEANKKDIKPFKKVKRRNRKNVIIAIGICLVMFGAYLYTTCYGWKANLDDVEVSYSYSGRTIAVSFEMKNNMGMRVVHTSKGEACIEIRKTLSIFSSGGGGYTLTVPYVDENGRVLSEDQIGKIKIGFADGVVTYDYVEIGKELGAFKMNRETMEE